MGGQCWRYGHCFFVLSLICLFDYNTRDGLMGPCGSSALSKTIVDVSAYHSLLDFVHGKTPPLRLTVAQEYHFTCLRVVVNCYQTP